MTASGDLVRSLRRARLLPDAKHVEDQDSDPALPRFQIHQMVTVLLNERNRTPHTGTIREAIWHHKLECWHYFLEEDGKTISKRYAAG